MQTVFGWKPILLLCCAAFSSQIAHSQSASSPAASPSNPAALPESRPVSRTLTDLGHVSGFQQTGPDSSISFTMPMPLDTTVSSARLVLHYAVSTGSSPDSSMRIAFNGSIRQVIDLSEAAESAGRSAAGTAAQRVLSIPLTAHDLSQPFLEVQVQASFGAQDRCAAPDANRDLLNLLPQTSLSYRAQPETAPSVRGYLSTLPTNARIAIAPGVTDEALRAGWLLSRELQDRGHRISYTHLQEGSDVLIGPSSLLGERGISLEQDATLGLVTPDSDQPYRFQLVMTEPYYADALGAPWNLLLGGQAYARSTAQALPGDDPARLGLAALGLDTGVREFTGAAEWVFPSRTIPAGRMPVALHLDLVTPPAPGDDPLIVYVLQNGSLLGLTPLAPEGGGQQVSIPLAMRPSIADAPLRIVLKRQSHDCTTPPLSGFVQLLDSSVLETVAREGAAESVAEFGRLLAGSYSLHLPESAPEQPQAWIRALAELGRGLTLDPRRAELRTTGMAPPAERPFIWFGEQPPPEFDSAVAVDRGRFQIRQRSGEVLLDSGTIQGASMVSLLRNGSQRGLWVRTLGEGVPVVPPGLENTTGDLILGDQNGVLISLATSDTVVGIAYPEHVSWLSEIARYRVWLFLLIWAVLTIVVIAVARRMRNKHK